MLVEYSAIYLPRKQKNDYYKVTFNKYFVLYTVCPNKHGNSVTILKS